MELIMIFFSVLKKKIAGEIIYSFTDVNTENQSNNLLQTFPGQVTNKLFERKLINYCF